MENSSPKKSLGQHWLHDTSVLQAIAEAAEPTSDDTILEIGPGLGTLTSELLNSGARVIAVEFDDGLLEGLQKSLGDRPNFELVHADIRTYNLTNLPPYKIVANIPYYLTSQLLRIICDSTNPPDLAVLLVQKEVAERVCATPPDMSILSVAVQYEFQANLDIVVPSVLFTPPPKVDSQVMVLTKRKDPLFTDVAKKDFMRVVKSGFSAKRKTLRNTLSAGLAISKQQADELLQAATIDPGRRAETLTIDEWHTLTALHYNNN